jgi:hypothetical protein
MHGPEMTPQLIRQVIAPVVPPAARDAVASGRAGGRCATASSDTSASSSSEQASFFLAQDALTLTLPTPANHHPRGRGLMLVTDTSTRRGDGLLLAADGRDARVRPAHERGCRADGSSRRRDQAVARPRVSHRGRRRANPRADRAGAIAKNSSAATTPTSRTRSKASRDSLQLLHRSQRHGRRLSHHPFENHHGRGDGTLKEILDLASSKGLVLVTGPTGSGNRRPSPRWSTTSIAIAPITSSRSRSDRVRP